MAESTLSPISINGKAFVDKSGKRFMVRGVALSSNTAGVDLLTDDYSDYMKNYVIPELISLSINVIRVYQVHESESHANVMAMLEEQGIYVMVGLVNQEVCVNNIDPQYTLALYNRITTIASEFAKYANTFAFSVGNEVVFPGVIYKNTTPAYNADIANQIITTDAQVMKSMISDLKAYLVKNKSTLRQVPVGMAMQDGATPTVVSWLGIGTDTVAEYYASGDPSSRADFIGINAYRYINSNVPGPMNSYDGLANEVLTIPVPVFLTESGGMQKDPSSVTPEDPMGHPYLRDWAIVSQVYSETLLNQNLSGQIAFEFFNKKENLGLYTENPISTVNPFPLSTPLSTTPYGGASNLAAQFMAVKSISVSLPPSVTDPSVAPSALFAPNTASAVFNPPLLPCPAPTISITIENYANVDLVAVQNGTEIAQLPAISGSQTFTSTSAMVSDAYDLLIQEPGTWISVCKVTASSLTDGLVVQNNVVWGNVSCTI